MRMLKFGLVLCVSILCLSLPGFAQDQVKIHSREQLETLTEQMCFYLEGHNPEFSHTRLGFYFGYGAASAIRQPFESQGNYTARVEVFFYDSKEQSSEASDFLTARRGCSGAYYRGLGDEAWGSSSGEFVIRKGTTVISVSLREVERPSTNSQNRTDHKIVKSDPTKLEYEEVEVYEGFPRKLVKVKMSKSPITEYGKEIAGRVLEFFEQYGN